MRFFKKKDVAVAFQGARQVAENVESLRENILTLRASQRDIEQLPVEEQEALNRVERWIAHHTANVSSRSVLTTSMFGSCPKNWRFPEGQLADAVAIYLAPQVEAAMKANVRRFYQTTSGVSEGERSDRLDEIDRQILDLELAEESIIREAEKYGMTLQRREDADPRAVLAHDSALP